MECGHRLSRGCAAMLVIAALMVSAGCQGLQSRNLNADGVRYYQSGQYEAAASMFAEAARVDPQNADAYYNLAAARHQLAKLSGQESEFHLAEQYYRYALTASPQHTDSHRGLSALLLDAKRPQEAEEHLMAWSRMAPYRAEPMIELAKVKFQSGRRDEAVTLLREAALIDPTKSEALVYLGQLQEHNGDAQSALASYQMALQQNPRQPGVAQRVAQLRQQVLLGPAPANGSTQMANDPQDRSTR